MKRTKIVVTVSPAIEKEELLAKLIDIGVDVFRFRHLNILKIRKISKEKGRYIATLMDLSGPKIRIGLLKNPLC